VDILSEANRQPDPAKRFTMIARAEAMLLDAQPVVPLMSNATNWMKKPWVKGMYPNPETLHAWKFVYIEHDPTKWLTDAPVATQTMYGPAEAGHSLIPAQAGQNIATHHE
jgi:oligopeptide transport system substrate-binding protein